jgi:hypothetical protein
LAAKDSQRRDIPSQGNPSNFDLETTPEITFHSMARLKYTTALDAGTVQNIIDLMIELGYVDKGVRASNVLD